MNTEGFSPELLLLIATSALLTWAIAWGVQRAAFRLGLVSQPNARSSHRQPTPHGGGLGMVLAGTLAGGWLAWSRGVPVLGETLGLALLLAMVGLRDDFRALPVRMRFAVHGAVCTGLLGLLGLLTAPLGMVVLMLLLGIWWINLFNFMDGIDGLAAAQALFMLGLGALLAAWGHSERMVQPLWVMMPCLAAAAAGFLWINWPPAKIFMGDVGSTWMAFMIFAMALMSILAGWLEISTWLILGAGFIADASVTLLVRIATGQRWTEAHRSHAYQRLARRWHSHRKVTLLVGAFNLLWLLPLAGAAQVWPQWGGIGLMLAYAPALAGVTMWGAGKPNDG
ncbi:MAG: glycosyltransferase family 4 protein [Betaproteobacteria bacterium]|nr:glycosyltransferase family 4 protein [Betaproteobacteria bacterium]